MDSDVCYNYLELIDKSADYFYSRNPVCKYLPESIGLENINPVDIQNVLKVGLCKEIIDIFDEEALKTRRKECEKVYRPSSKWALKKSETSYPWQYYQHLLYKKNKI